MIGLVESQPRLLEVDGTERSSFHSLKALARLLAGSLPDERRLKFARIFCRSMTQAYWQKKCREVGVSWQILNVDLGDAPLTREQAALAESLGESCADMGGISEGYELGAVYTCLLPSAVRTSWGSFYTPPQYASRLIELASEAGFDWSRGTAVDPACGGGAFLAPLGLKMAQSSPCLRPADVLADIFSRLRGFEIDPFAAWLSHVTLEAALLPLCADAALRLPRLITVCDSLQLSPAGTFDLVIGNPPFGKVRLSEALRKKFARSLYGHANLYGLFTDLAVRLAKDSGVIAYVTPTSFLGGQYFKSLRRLLFVEAPPVAIDFVAERDGVFEGVLQEMLLVAFRKGASPGPVLVSGLRSTETGGLCAEPVEEPQSVVRDGPWILARSTLHQRSAAKLSSMSCRLRHYGYRVSTGPLVWNRHKPQLRSEPGQCRLPLIWAESVSLEGFSFRHARKNHTPYLELAAGQRHLVLSQESVLVQRTTAKEQHRRLVSAVIEQEFLDAFGGAIVENHLNVVKAPAEVQILPSTIARVLNSRAADNAFRCISGSVAVSAYELESLPLPAEDTMIEIQDLLRDGNAGPEVELLLEQAYGAQ